MVEKSIGWMCAALWGQCRGASLGSAPFTRDFRALRLPQGFSAQRPRQWRQKMQPKSVAMSVVFAALLSVAVAEEGGSPIVPIEPDFVRKMKAFNLPMLSASTINSLVALVRRPFSGFSSHRGYHLSCNEFSYDYEIEDKGGHWIVTVK